MSMYIYIYLYVHITLSLYRWYSPINNICVLVLTDFDTEN